MIDTIAQYPILAALIALVGLGILFGGLLGFAAEKFKVEGDPIVEQIDELLPQTQCGQSVFPAVSPTPNLLLMATPLTNVLPVAKLPSTPLLACLMCQPLS